MRLEDQIIINEIKKGNKYVYKALFADFYENLVHFANSFLFDQDESEDIVQDFFIYLWDNPSKIDIRISLKAYFYQAIRNRCLNRLKSIQVKDKHHLQYLDGMLQTDDELEHFDPHILTSIKESIDELPDQMSKIFKLRVLEGESRDVIAERHGISINTVKTQLSRAKAKLRISLLDKTDLLFFL